MDRDTLLRSIGVHAPPRHLFLLGAGASITSGVPSASDVIWRWKREIFLSSLPPGASEFIQDPALPSARRLIQAGLDARGGFPAEGSPEEYTFYAQYAFPEPAARQRFFLALTRGASPSAGYRLLAHLIEMGMFSGVFTTNFDHLLLRAKEAGASRVILEASPDASVHVQSQIVEDDGVFLHVALHGDYRYDTLKNTGAELQDQERLLGERLERSVRRRPLVVVGYSGRDASVMRTLARGYSEPGSGGLYWVGYRGASVLPEVERLLALARENGYEAHYVEDEGFDVFMRRLAAYLLREQPSEAERLRGLLGVDRAAPRSTGLHIAANHATDRLLKSNVWEVRLDVTMFAAEAAPECSWQAIREALKSHTVVAGLWKGKVYAAGELAEIRRVLNALVKPVWEPYRPSTRDLSDGYLLQKVVEEALVRGLGGTAFECRRAGGAWLLHRREEMGRTRCGAKVVPFYSAVNLSLVRDRDRFLLSVIPDRYLGDTEEDDKDGRAATLNALLSKQYNGPFNEEMKAWAASLGLVKGALLSFPRASGSNVQFEVVRGPLFAQFHDSARGEERTPAKGASVVGFRATEVDEVPLRFGEGRDTHPIQGLLRHGPADAGVHRLERGVRVGIVAPSGHFGTLRELIRALAQRHEEVETKAEYLRGYPGFHEAYRVPLLTPVDEPSLFEEVKVSGNNADLLATQDAILYSVTSAAERMVARSNPSVVIVFVPDEWAPFEEVERGEVRFDFHDRMKAHLAARGIRSQLVRQSTLSKDQRLEILWWLSLALYAKAIRTPWLIDKADNGAVYVGIGYSRSRDPKGGLIVGCGHVFEASGVGLRFSLGRVPAPFHKSNPYLSEEQAFDLGVSTRQLFFESRLTPPRRALVVKRTPFRKEEVAGILAGLSGVPAVDLVSIERGDDWRFIAAGKPELAAAFPVKRGTLVEKMNGDLLLFAHGSVQGRQRTYFKGGARIPSPLVIRRYAGETSAETLARDVLAMTRMDWNSFDMYQSEPAPLVYASRIADISAQFTEGYPEAMDYRLFI